MSDVIYSILIAGFEALLLPIIYRRLKKHIKRHWIVVLLIVLIAVLMAAILGTAVSVISYYVSRL